MALLGAPRTQSRGPVRHMKARLDAGFPRYDGRENLDDDRSLYNTLSDFRKRSSASNLAP